jgi:hypothetical protein
MTNASPADFNNVPDEMLGELLREAEECLQGTVQLALAADQRGATMTGIFGAGAVALLAAAATIPETADRVLGAFLTASIFLFVAALLTAWSARPANFFIGGYEPRFLSQCGGDLAWMQRCTSADVQNRITKNREALEGASRLFSAGVILAGISPFLAIGIYFLMS